MEQDIAILIADLSGYTALTETHGSISAADLIEKYIYIAESCLVGNTQIHERKGDEIMFVSDSPDALLATALQLEAETVLEENFLLVHGALHYGKVLKRGDHYYGAAINLVSRIAAKAAPGTFWCSDDFLNALANRSAGTFVSKGFHTFKNIAGEKEVFELGIERVNARYIDPICRMVIVNQDNAIPHPHESGIYFCSHQCLQIYQENFRPQQ